MSRYQVNGRDVPSVTEIIRDVLGDQYHSGPDKQWYLDRGQAVHACAALIMRGMEFDHDPAIAGQVAAIRKFVSDVLPDVVAVEHRVESKRYQYAGTLDAIMMIGLDRCIVDWKASLTATVGIQLAGYSIAWHEMGGAPIRYGYGVEIHEDGTYKMSERYALKTERAEFLALRTVAGMRQKYKLGGYGHE